MARGIAFFQEDTSHITARIDQFLRDMVFSTTSDMLQNLASDRDLLLFEDGGCNSGITSIKGTGIVRIIVSAVTRL
ncbi:hypothetical protein A2U01_0082247, partial [Trifolium medium]|nr:hypothetical protein [Trifolium medium]